MTLLHIIIDRAIMFILIIRMNIIALSLIISWLFPGKIFQDCCVLQKILVFWKRLLFSGKLCCVLKRLLIVKNVFCYSELLAHDINWIKTFLASAIRNIKNWCMLLLVQLGACSSYLEDITWPRGKTKFSSRVEKYFTS